MAISVSTDLVAVSTCDTLTDGGQWYRLNGTSSANPAADTDAMVQNNGCVANKCGATTGTTDVGGHFNHTTTFDLTNQLLFYWRQILTPANMLTKANQGITVGLTNTSITSNTTWSTTNYKKWFMDGSDTLPVSPGWKPYCLDPLTTPDLSAGTLTLTTVKNISFAVRQTSGITTTLSSHFVDGVRRGTGLTVTTSSGGDVVAMSDVYNTDNTITNRWGVVTQVAGIYYGQGKINIGSAAQGQVCTFTDSSQLFIWRKNLVPDSFQEFNLKGAASFKTNVTLTGWVIRGEAGQKWGITCDANGNWKSYGCAMSNINAAVLSAGSILDGGSITASGRVTTNGATVGGVSFSAHLSNQVLCSSPSQVNNITNCGFTKGAATAHAIEVTGTAANFTLSGITFSGYSVSDGSTGNEAVFVNIASGTVEITVLNGSNPSIRTAGATVSFAATPVTVKVTVKDAVTGAALQDVRVLVEKVSDGTDILTGSTNASGILSGSYSYTADTAVVGVARRASPGLGTLYKQNAISGTITNTGLDVTVLLSSDE